MPAAVRKRWGTRTVLAEDRGDELVLRPAPDDPIAAVRGIFADEIGSGPTSDDMRAVTRVEDADLEQRRARSR